MANTSDTLGIQTTLDKLIAHELTSFEDDTVTSLRQKAFSLNTGIEYIKLPNCDATNPNPFNGCVNLSTVDLSKQITPSNVWFGGNYFLESLSHLILRFNGVCPIGTFAQALINTPIARGLGAIYVPSNLVDTYKAATNWSVAADQIYALEDYPVAEFDTIKDDWNTIITKLDNGTANYVVGDTKSMIYDGKVVLMQLVALNADDLADGSGKAKSTWISRVIIGSYKINSANTTQGWSGADARSYLRNAVRAKLPSNIRSAIKEVTKTYCDPYKETKSLSETVWIPSYREIFGGTDYEDSGVIYGDIYSSDASRQKLGVSGNAFATWWTRSAHSVSQFVRVSSNGTAAIYGLTNSNGLVLGFCI